jgi:hypothetical protein
MPRFARKQGIIVQNKVLTAGGKQADKSKNEAMNTFYTNTNQN